VFGLNFSTTEKDLYREFGKYGRLEKVHVVLDGPSKRSRGFAFIYFERVEDAIAARDALNGTDLAGFAIRVDFSITKEAHKPTPGVYFHHGKATRPGEIPRRGEGGDGGAGRGSGGRGNRGFRGGGRGRGGGGGPPYSSSYRDDRDRDRYYGGGGGGRDHYKPSSSSYYPPASGSSRGDYYDSRDRYERDRYERDRYYDKYDFPPAPPPPRYDDRYRDRGDPYYADKFYSRERGAYEDRYYSREREYEPRDKYYYDRPPAYDKYDRYERERYPPGPPPPPAPLAGRSSSSSKHYASRRSPDLGLPPVGRERY
jgi:RNA recognition motif-containing protein